MLHGVFHGELPQHDGAAVPGGTRAASPKIRGQDRCRGGAQHKEGPAAAPWGLATLGALDGQAIVTLGWRGAAPKLAAEGVRGAAPPGRHAAPLS